MKKRILAILLTLVMALALTVPALAAPAAVTTVRVDSFLSGADESGALIVEVGGKYGAYAPDGTQLAAPTYTYAKPYSGGMAAVTMEGSMQVIFDWGVPEMDNIVEFEDAKYGYLDESGKLAIPMQYVQAFDFHDDRAFVRETEDGPLLMIDKTGNVIATYTNVDLWYYETVQFSEGLAIIPLQDDYRNTYYIAVDTSGKTVYTFDDAYVDFENGYSDGLVAVAAEGWWGTGGPCLERGINDMSGVGYRNQSGQKVIALDEYKIAELGAFAGGMAMVSQYDENWNWKCGFIDTTGKLVVPMEYDSYWHPENGYAAVAGLNGVGAIVDKTGRFLTDFLYESIWNSPEGLLARSTGGIISAIDTNGDTVFTTPEGCTKASGYFGGVTIFVNPDTQQGYVYDKQGNDVTPMNFSGGYVWTAGYVWLGNDGTYTVFRTADLLEGTGEAEQPETPTVTFTDVPAGRYFTAPVAWAVEQGITDGAGNNQFLPGRTCTNGEIITFLWRAAGELKASQAAPITAKYAGFADAINWAYEQGIIDSSFQETADCTRANTVTYIWKAKSSPAASGSNDFTDIPAGADYIQAVNWAVGAKVTDGTGNGSTFSPNDTCTRGEIVTFLYRAFAD